MRVLGLSLVIVLASSCGGETAGDGESLITFDTLPGGAVLVRNPETGLWRDGEEWRLVEELRIGSAEGAGPDAFASVVDLEVDAAGRIYVLDLQAKEIRVFDADGYHVRTFGREGEGPGEMRNPRGMAFYRNGTLWVFDPGNARLTVFDTTSYAVTTHHRDITGYGARWFGEFDREGRLVEPAVTIGDQGVREVLVRFDRSLESADSFPLPWYEMEMFEFRGDRVSGMFKIPFAPELHRVIDPQGFVWLGISEEYRIVRTTFEGDTLLVIEKEHRPTPVTEAEVDAEIDRSLQAFEFEIPRSGVAIDRSRFPKVRPAYDDFLVEPDGHLWVEPAGRDTAAILDVFDPRGRYLGAVRSPVELGSRRPWRFHGDRLYAVVTDELDVPYVVRFRIERGER